MDYLASKLLGLLGTSSFLLFAPMLMGTLLLWRRGWKAGRLVVTLSMILLLVCAVTPLQTAITGAFENRFPARPDLPDRIEGIIILGGMLRPHISQARGRPTLNDAAERLLDGAMLAARFPDCIVLFTGGSADPWDPKAREADFAGQLLRQMGVAGPRLVIEDRSRNTYENAVFSRRLLPQPPHGAWILVTSALHMPRAVGVFRAAGWEIIPWPVNYLTGGDGDWINEDQPILRLQFLSRTLHEAIGLVYYRLRGWTRQLFPAP